MSKMRTPKITVWFPKLGFFILEKQLASQYMFLVQPEVEVRLIPTNNSHAIRTFSITAYHKSQITVCLVKIRTPPITLQFKKNLIGFPYFTETMRSKLSVTVYLFLALYGSTILQSWSFLKNIKNFLCK